MRFGADKVFRAASAEVSADDIDAIIERGKAKTDELSKKFEDAQKGDLLDFKLDGSGIETQEWNGVDYSSRAARERLANGGVDPDGGGMPFGGFLLDTGKRERKAVNYASTGMTPTLSLSSGGGGGSKKVGPRTVRGVLRKGGVRWVR